MINKFSELDHYFMQQALALGARGHGRTSPNPSVGCVIVNQDFHIIGRGFTGSGGQPHAEINALEKAKSLGYDTAGAAVYVTLEPCSHTGKTPPCADALVNAGIKRVIIASNDPDKRVNGKGVLMLEKAGIKVEKGLCKEEADFQHGAFFSKCGFGLPLITLKFATTLDGKIAHNDGKNKWITCETSRKIGHQFRAKNDAIMVGIGTVFKDDPDLRCRIKGLESRSPVRIILDSHLKMPLDSKLIKTAKDVPLWIITVCADKKKHENFIAFGAKIIIVPKDKEGRVDLKKAMKIINKRGINSILSEGGSKVNTSLIKENLMSRIIWFKSPDRGGEGALPALEGTTIEEMCRKIDLKLIKSGAAQRDKWYYYSK